MKRLLPPLLCLLAGAASAEPRFAARTGWSCASCHVNPSGGGLRTAYGRDVFNKQQLTFFSGSGLQRALDFDPRLADLFTFGADFRAAYLGQPARPDLPRPGVTGAAAGLFVKTPARHSVFPMQADLYVAADLTRFMTFYLDYGVHGSFEVTGLLHDLPGGLYLKLGMFTPAYGIKLANHTAAHRQPIGFDPRTAKDAGLEVGLIHRWFEAQAAVQNGDLSGNPLASSDGLAVTGRAAARVELDALKLSAGLSGRRAHTFQLNSARDGKVRRLEYLAGPFGWASLGRFAYLAELDFHVLVDASQPDALGAATRSGQLVTYQELRFLAGRGIDIGVTHEFMDRDLYRSSSPADVVHRLGLELAVFPAPYVHVELFARAYLARADREESGQWELIAFLHLYF